MSGDSGYKTVTIQSPTGSETVQVPIDPVTGRWTVALPLPWPAERPRARRRGISGPLWSWLAYRALRWLMLALGSVAAGFDHAGWGVQTGQFWLQDRCVKAGRCPQCGCLLRGLNMCPRDCGWPW